MEFYFSGKDKKTKKEGFITNYEKCGDDIIVKYATGDTWSIINIEENEKKILDIMIEEANESVPLLYSLKEKRNKLLTGLLPAAAILFGTFFIPLTIIPFTFLTLPVAPFIPSVVCSIIIEKIIKNSLIIKELVKMERYLSENEDMDGYHYNYNDDEIYKDSNLRVGVSKKAQKVLSVKPQTPNHLINLNNLDNFTLKDLKQLKINREMVSEFRFDTQEQEAQMKQQKIDREAQDRFDLLAQEQEVQIEEKGNSYTKSAK